MPVRFKLTKKRADALKKAARRLPPDFYLVERSRKMTGQEIIDKGLTEAPIKKQEYTIFQKIWLWITNLFSKKRQEIPVSKIEPEKIYTRTYKEPIQINHARRLKDIYQKSGDEGVNQYFNNYGFKLRSEVENGNQGN